MFLRLVVAGMMPLMFAVPTFAAKTSNKEKAAEFKALVVPKIEDFSTAEWTQLQADWKKNSRKVASEQNFSEGDLSADFKKFRDEWLKVETGVQMEALLNASYGKYDGYSADMKYFLAQIHVLRSARGLVWRMRPMFEEGNSWLGNKATHVAAVQFVRAAAVGLDSLFPTSQTDAFTEYMTQPSPQMSPKTHQFKTIFAFQKWLTESFIPALNESVYRTKKVLAANPAGVFVWDNKMFYGTGSFQDGIKRYSGYGAAEMHVSLSGAYSAIHDALVFSAYNQDAALQVARDLGRLVGIDSVGFRGDGDLGVTDEERVAIVRKAATRAHFLELRNYEGTTFGSDVMMAAYIAKKNSVLHAAEAYDKLKSKSANTAMAINPLFYQTDAFPRLEGRIQSVKSLVEKAGDARDPVSGQVVTLDIPAFYKNPPKSMASLMPVAFEAGSHEYSISNSQGDKMTYRNYKRGRANSWDNKEWAKYVPSAAGKNPAYMADAKRVMNYSIGAGQAFGVVNLFVR